MDNPYQQDLQPTNITCLQCGYDLTGSAVGGYCPECGTPVANTLRPMGSRQNAPNSVACMILGILSLTVCGLLGPIAIMLYYNARNHYQSGYYSSSSMSMAKAGLITGWIATGLMCLWILVAVLSSLS